jgi:hypothetical protein
MDDRQQGVAFNLEEMAGGHKESRDNAPAHFNSNHPDWTAAASQMVVGCWNIGLKNQCPNIPDTNLCDFGFFRTLHSEQLKLPCGKNVDMLIERVQEALELLNSHAVDANFLTLATELS